MKRWRIYFHKRNGADPVVWSVDEGDQSTEMHVQWFHIDPGFDVVSRVDLAAKDGMPLGWIELYAMATFERGGVIFRKAE